MDILAWAGIALVVAAASFAVIRWVWPRFGIQT